MCVVYVLPEPAQPGQIGELEFTPITLDWYGNSTSERIAFRIIVDPLHIIFSFNTTLEPVHDPSHKPGMFVEGLWEQDVMEIFLAEDGSSSRYQEFNVAPSGAWWSQVFTRYREPVEDVLLCRNTVLTQCDLTDGWSGALYIPRDSLGIHCLFEDSSRLNVCGIYGQDPRIYLSATRFSKPKPDFHLANEFSTIHRIHA